VKGRFIVLEKAHLSILIFLQPSFTKSSLSTEGVERPQLLQLNHKVLVLAKALVLGQGSLSLGILVSSLSLLNKMLAYNRKIIKSEDSSYLEAVPSDQTETNSRSISNADTTPSLLAEGIDKAHPSLSDLRVLALVFNDNAGELSEGFVGGTLGELGNLESARSRLASNSLIVPLLALLSPCRGLESLKVLLGLESCDMY